MSPRNKDICIALLNGERSADLARKHGVSRPRIEKILRKALQQAAPNYYSKTMTELPYHAPRIEAWRKDKENLIDAINTWKPSKPWQARDFQTA